MTFLPNTEILVRVDPGITAKHKHRAAVFINRSLVETVHIIDDYDLDSFLRYVRPRLIIAGHMD